MQCSQQPFQDDKVRKRGRPNWSKVTLSRWHCPHTDLIREVLSGIRHLIHECGRARLGTRRFASLFFAYQRDSLGQLNSRCPFVFLERLLHRRPFGLQRCSWAASSELLIPLFIPLSNPLFPYPFPLSSLCCPHTTFARITLSLSA